LKGEKIIFFKKEVKRVILVLKKPKRRRTIGSGTKQNAAFRRETLEKAKHAQNQKRQ